MADWKNEIESRLKESEIYNQLVVNLNLGDKATESQQLQIVFKCVNYAYQKSKLIIKYMPEYTLHDGEHLFRVLYLMEKIVSKEKIKQLSSAELVLLIISAFFHDLGMAPIEEKVKAWNQDLENDKSAKDDKAEFEKVRAWNQDWENDRPTEEEKIEFEKFSRFRNTYPDILSDIEKFSNNNKDRNANLLKSHLISEYIRSTHAQRAREIIARDWKHKIVYQDQDLTSSLASLCFSHNEDALNLLNLDNDLIVNDTDTVNLPFLGVVLRLADLLDFDAKRTPSVLFSHLAVKNPISLLEWKKHRSIKAWKIEPNKIIYSAICTHPAIESSIHQFCDYIDFELKNCSLVLTKSSLKEVYKLDLPPKVDRSKIQAEKDIETGEPIYIYRNTSFHLSKRQVIDLLMGTKLYGKPEVALRELIQNSIDACLLSKALHDKWNVPYKPKIIVKYYSKEGSDYLEINDNGIGMNQEIVDKYYSNIGSSFYKSREFYDLKASNELEFQPISRFGIGILSCFMVADSFEVETKRLKDQYEYDSPLKIAIEGYDSIFSIYKSTKKEPGTNTKLILRKNKNPWDKLSSDKFIQAVKSSILKPDIPIEIITDKKVESYTDKVFYSFDINELRSYQWSDNNNNLRQIEFKFNCDGLEGGAVVGFITKDGMPVTEIEILNESVEVNGEEYELSLEMKYDFNEIRKSSQSISIDDDGDINSDNNYSTVAESKSRFSIHGITFPGKIFPDYMSRNKNAMLKWNFPMLININLGGILDLDLNSARNEILFNEKWDIFETKLSEVICSGIKQNVEPDFWKELRKVILNKSKSKNFLEGLKIIGE